MKKGVNKRVAEKNGRSKQIHSWTAEVGFSKRQSRSVSLYWQRGKVEWNTYRAPCIRDTKGNMYLYPGPSEFPWQCRRRRPKLACQNFQRQPASVLRVLKQCNNSLELSQMLLPCSNVWSKQYSYTLPSSSTLWCVWPSTSTISPRPSWFVAHTLNVYVVFGSKWYTSTCLCIKYIIIIQLTIDNLCKKEIKNNAHRIRWYVRWNYRFPFLRLITESSFQAIFGSKVYNGIATGAWNLP